MKGYQTGLIHVLWLTAFLELFVAVFGIFGMVYFGSEGGKLLYAVALFFSGLSISVALGLRKI